MNPNNEIFDEPSNSKKRQNSMWSYLIIHGFIINGGMLLITLIIWGKMLEKLDYDSA
jgi:hypothetical protein